MINKYTNEITFFIVGLVNTRRRTFFFLSEHAEQYSKTPQTNEATRKKIVTTRNFFEKYEKFWLFCLL